MSRLRKYAVLGTGGALAVAAVLTGRAIAASPSSDGSFRTAVASTASVTQSLLRSGTIEPVAQAGVAFPISGTVATVAVHVGDSVTTGQQLAALDPTGLQSDLTSKQAALAQAQLTLQNALTAATTAAAAAARPTTTSTSTPTTSTTAPAQTDDAKAQLDPALKDAQSALASADAACTAQPDSASAQSGAQATAQPSSPANCLTAQREALAAAQKLADIEKTIAKAAPATGGTSGSGSTTRSAAPPATRSSSAAASAGGTATGTTSAKAPSAEDLVADQAAVDAAAAQVTAAQQNLAQATIVSPMNGTVAAVNLAAGQQVSAGSTTATVVVVGTGGYEVATTAAVADIGDVKVGEHATVTPDGSSTPLDAEVVAVGVAPSSGSSASYPVVLGFTAPATPDGLRNGASASVDIDVAKASQALTVPTSAIHTAGGFRFVMTLTNGKTSNIPVQVGAVGSALTEIKSGLTAGATVVLADLSQPLPSSNTTNRGFGAGGAGAFGGAGGFGGGGFAPVRRPGG